MRKLVFLMLILFMIALPVQAGELEAPRVPENARENMPEDPGNLLGSFSELFYKAAGKLRPDLQEACRVSLSAIAAVMLVSAVSSIEAPVARMSDLAGTAAVCLGLLKASHALITLGAETVISLSQYGKLLLPVMSGALAAQGGISSSAALYAGTAGFSALLSSLISRVLIPLTYLFLVFSLCSSALGQQQFQKLRDLVKSLISWCLKTTLSVFLAYMGLTGVISGTADAAAVKATRTAVSAAVPVVGSILSGASETMLVSIGMLKNAAGIYGIFAVIAIFLDPFLKILLHYWVLKLTGAVCSIFGNGRVSSLVGDFGTAMGLLLAMTGTACLLILIAAVCFMKGVG